MSANNLPDGYVFDIGAYIQFVVCETIGEQLNISSEEDSWERGLFLVADKDEWFPGFIAVHVSDDGEKMNNFRYKGYFGPKEWLPIPDDSSLYISISWHTNNERGWTHKYNIIYKFKISARLINEHVWTRDYHGGAAYHMERIRKKIRFLLKDRFRHGCPRRLFDMIKAEEMRILEFVEELE